MTRYKVVVTSKAYEDLYNIVQYIKVELLEPQVARSMLEKLESTISSLESLPKRYALVQFEEFAHRQVRKVAVENYIIFYVVNEYEQIVRVLRVLYGKREWQDLL